MRTSTRPVVMPAAPIPVDEPERLRTLRALKILDTPPEHFSHAVSAAAASIANTPIAAVTLVDADRQTFKGACGVDAASIPRTVSFCAHAILGTAPLVVPDARADARFLDNPLVLGEPHLRFYAGFPLVVDGQPVGALCVLDDRERELSGKQIEALERLAAGTSVWLERREGSDE